MKIKDIVEGVLGSLVKGMAQGAGLSRVDTDDDKQQTQMTPLRRTSTASVASKPKTSSKHDIQVVVDKPGQPLTIRYNGQLYSSEGGLRSKWVNTKTNREVNSMFQSVLDAEWERYVGESK